MICMHRLLHVCRAAMHAAAALLAGRLAPMLPAAMVSDRVRPAKADRQYADRAATAALTASPCIYAYYIGPPLRRFSSLPLAF